MTIRTHPPRHRMPRAGLRVSKARRTRSCSGFTLLEVSVVCVIMAVALIMLSGTIASTAQVAPLNTERFRAAEAAADIIELMHSSNLDDLFLLYNANPADDPVGVGTAPGAAFDIEGFSAVEGDPDGRVGRILMPEVDGRLSEVLEDSLLGVPRDLNADTEIDDLDHAEDWVILPVVVRIEWSGANGDRSIYVPTMFARVP
jgi:prepilin-type N-terminal cleavage/methylation domain-containing protein